MHVRSHASDQSKRAVEQNAWGRLWGSSEELCSTLMLAVFPGHPSYYHPDVSISLQTGSGMYGTALQHCALTLCL
eukprot:scaffold192529_cov23-Tisochrysis_lutea.AAC.3